MNSALFSIIGIRSLERVTKMLKGELAEQVFTGDIVHLPFRGKETVFAILGVGVTWIRSTIAWPLRKSRELTTLRPISKSGYN